MENVDRVVGIAFAGALCYMAYLTWQRTNAPAPWRRFAWIASVAAVVLLDLSAFGIAIPAWGKYALVALAIGSLGFSRLRGEPRSLTPEPEAFTQARIGAQMTLSALQGKNHGEQRD